MTLTELCIITETQLNIEWINNLQKYHAELIDIHLTRVETTERIGGGIFTGTSGWGKTKEKAIRNLCNSLQEKVIVINVINRKKRRYYPMPDKINPRYNIDEIIRIRKIMGVHKDE